MIDFCPDGYLATAQAITDAARCWFPERFAAPEKTATSQQEVELEGPIERAVRIFSQPLIPDDWRQAFEATVNRLRNLLHEGKLQAYYFDNDGPHTTTREFWATAYADGVLETGVYWPFGQPSRKYEQLPNYPLFLLQSELDMLLSPEPANKRSLARSQISQLVVALRDLEDLPNREAQYEALCELPQFREFKITRADFREAARRMPRKGGRKSRKESRH